MTNEERAREIAEYYTDINDIGVALNSAKEMAEWKDEQFKDYLEKKKKNLYYRTDTAGVCNYALINEIIGELFKED